MLPGKHHARHLPVSFVCLSMSLVPTLNPQLHLCPASLPCEWCISRSQSYLRGDGDGSPDLPALPLLTDMERRKYRMVVVALTSPCN